MFRRELFGFGFVDVLLLGVLEEVGIVGFWVGVVGVVIWFGERILVCGVDVGVGLRSVVDCGIFVVVGKICIDGFVLMFSSVREIWVFFLFCVWVRLI